MYSNTVLKEAPMIEDGYALIFPRGLVTEPMENRQWSMNCDTAGTLNSFMTDLRSSSITFSILSVLVCSPFIIIIVKGNKMIE